MFIIFILFHQVFSDNSCEFKSISSLSTSVKNTAEVSRGFLSKFNVNTTNYYPGSYIFQDIGNDFFYYFLGCASLGIPFLFFFFFFIIFFVSSCLCSLCSCCRPLHSKKPNVLLAIFHFLGIIMFIISAILFLLACLDITNGIAEISDMPDSMKIEFNGIFNNIDGVFNSTFVFINQMVSGIENSLISLSSWLQEEGTISVGNAKAIDPLITKYKDVFTKEGQEYRNTKTNVDSSVESNKDSIDGGTSFVTKLKLMDQSIDPAIDEIQKLTQKMINSANEINTASQNIEKTIKESIQNVKKDINDFQNGDLVQQFNDLKSSIDSLVESLEPIKDLSFYVEEYVKPIIITATAFLLLIAVIFAIVFFCRNKFGRFCVCIYPLYGLLLTIAILLPAVAFSIFYLMLFDICPDLENVFQSFMGEANYGNLSGAIICEIEKPLLEMVDLDFDYRAILDDLGKQASSSLNTFEIPENLMNTLNNYGEGFDIKINMSSDIIIYNHTSTLNSLLEKINTASISNAENLIANIKKLKELIENEEPTLETSRELMTNVVEFGSSVIPQLNFTQKETYTIVDTFTAEAKTLISNGVNKITCRSVKCIYSPVKNALCVNLLSGMSYWLISSILLICALFVLSITICIRRKQMGDKPKVSNETSSESSAPKELEQFHR